MMAIGNSFDATMAKLDDTPETVIHRKDELMNTNKISPTLYSHRFSKRAIARAPSPLTLSSS